MVSYCNCWNYLGFFHDLSSNCLATILKWKYMWKTIAIRNFLLSLALSRFHQYFDLRYLITSINMFSTKSSTFRVKMQYASFPTADRYRIRVKNNRTLHYTTNMFKQVAMKNTSKEQQNTPLQTCPTRRLIDWLIDCFTAHQHIKAISAKKCC